ncbi:hypothetical protein MHLP_01410 [Candidatus Mycoplasma haematolamae str. Purdue]|uniref:Uncharacterized protein n=1 Tax=Mycoplasma haematolamae (strain Purdue) TaxID=1212765 RepID=I7C5R9_MYCHA|nr:hypothetical protein [Candidatus Mycoplasma haematolamae]AFO51862.1 hypothetical protein MHLP_01410 [Candidatus Mycoplasma haematolamae str. Purdue]
MEGERWYRLSFLNCIFALSIYLSAAIIYDLIIDHQNVTSGKFPCIVTALLTCGVQFGILQINHRHFVKLFKLHLLKENYSYWLVNYIRSSDKTKSLFGFKFRLFLIHWLNFLGFVFIFALGKCLKETVKSEAYYFNEWFGLAGALIFPVVRLFTSLIYIPNWTYKIFFRI